MIAIVHADLITPEGVIEDGTILLDDGKIAAVGGPDLPVPQGAATREAAGLIVAPGLIDLQVNGGFGRDFTADPSSIWDVAAGLPRFGVTAFLPTIITSPPETIQAAQDTVNAGPPGGWIGARSLGLHLEGPFLNPKKKGAHNPAHIRAPSSREIVNWSREIGVTLVTLAPELPGAAQVIGELVERGTVVSAGHSLASFEAAGAGFGTGIRYVTHLFNAMPALHHREPGLIAAALADDRLTVGLIADGLHVHPALVSLVWDLLGPTRLNLVTDAMAAMGMSPGEYALGDSLVTVDESSARLGDGTLAGCVLSLDAILRLFISFTRASLSEALSTVTAVPARLLGLDGRLGAIRPGMEADLVLLTPSIEVVETYVGGISAYRRP